MNFGDMFVDYRVEEAVLKCIAERGIDAADVDAIAAALERGRATIYRQYGDWPRLLAHTHGRVLEAVDGMFDSVRAMTAPRRTQFDDWWAQIIGFLRQPSGRAFRALRLSIFAE